MKSFNVRALTEGAIFASLTAILGIIITYVPFLQLLIYIWPTPLVIVSFKNGLKVGIVSAVVAAIVISIFTTPANGFALVLMLGLPGVVMGFCLSKKLNPYLVISITGFVMAVVMVLGVLATMMLFSPMASQNISTINDAFNEIALQAESLYKSMGISEKDYKPIIDMFKNIIETIKLLFPYIVITGGIIFSFINFKFTRLILKRTGHNITDIEKFTMWRIPEKAKFPVLIVVLILVYLKLNNIQILHTVTENLFMLTMFIFMVLGISLAAYYIDLLASKYDMLKPLKIIFVVIAVLVLRQVITMLAIIDIVVNIRGWKDKIL